jgi:hypothetical protein
MTAANLQRETAAWSKGIFIFIVSVLFISKKTAAPKRWPIES